MNKQTAHLSAIALNYEGASAPEWIQLTPKGPEIEGRDGRRWMLPNPEAVVAEFKRRGADLPIDYEHATQIKGSKGEFAPAVGWIKDMEVRNGALWARVEWGEDGQQAIASKAYRYISPVFTFARETGEVLQMRSAGLTNNPNLQLAALNREEDAAQKETDMDKAVLEALGLNSDASAADAVVAINKLKEARDTALNSAQQPDPEKFVPKADYDLAINKVSEFEQAEQARAEEAINTAVDAAIEAGKIAPSSRDFHVAACKASGVEAFNSMIEGLPKIGGKTDLDGKQPGKTGTALNAEEKAAADALGISHEDYAKAKEE